MHIVLHVQWPIFLSHLNGILMFRDWFRKKKITSNKFHENPSSGGRVVACGQTEGQI